MQPEHTIFDFQTVPGSRYGLLAPILVHNAVTHWYRCGVFLVLGVIWMVVFAAQSIKLPPQGCDNNPFSFIACVDAWSVHAGWSTQWWKQSGTTPTCSGSVPAADHHGSWRVLSRGQTATAPLRPAGETAAISSPGRQRPGQPPNTHT